MALFESCDNYDIEGVTHLNACYGSTDALFSAIAWIESNNNINKNLNLFYKVVHEMDDMLL